MDGTSELERFKEAQKSTIEDEDLDNQVKDSTITRRSFLTGLKERFDRHLDWYLQNRMG